MTKVLKAFISGLSQKEKKILYVASAFMFLALFDRLLYGPLSNESKTIDEKIENQKIMIRKDLIILKYKNKIKEEAQAHSIFYAASGMTHEELVAIFLREIESLAKENKVALTNINPVDVEEKTGFIQYSMVVECSGIMQDVLNYIYAIESAKKPIRVYSFEISPKKRESYEVNCSLKIIKIILMENEEDALPLPKKDDTDKKEDKTEDKKEAETQAAENTETKE